MNDKDEDEDEEDNSLIKYSCIFGTIKQISKFWDDLEDIGEKELLKYKIIKIKIYTGQNKDGTLITGVDMTYKNIFTGQILNREHRGNLVILDVKELEMKSGEYLTDFYIRCPQDKCFISQLGFGTNKKQNILLGGENGDNKAIESNGGGNIIVGTFGYFQEKLDTIGVLYIPKIKYMEVYLSGFFILRYMIKRKPQFKEEWEDESKNLSDEYKYIWRFINLPNSLFFNIIKYCFL